MNADELIPHDDLHWNESEGRFVSLSEDEINEVVWACSTERVDSKQAVLDVVRWAGEVRTSSILLRGVLEGRLGVTMKKGMKGPKFWKEKEIRPNWKEAWKDDEGPDVGVS